MNDNKKKDEFEYNEKFTFEQRKSEADMQLRKFPDKIPIVIQQSKTSKIIIPKDFKFKFVFPQEQTFGTFVFEIRKRIMIPPEKALFMFFCNNQIPASTIVMKDLYAKHKDEDGFLKLYFSEENVFG